MVPHWRSTPARLPYRSELPSEEVHTMDVLSAIQTRRSVRHEKADHVKDADLMMVLEAARWAPSWANTQCWRFVIVRDPVTKASLAGTLNPGNPATAAITEAPIVVAACAGLGR